MIDRLTTALSDRYRIERELGAGGMATVYLAEDLKHDRLVALKVLKPELAAVVGGERFLAEIKTTANLQHPHILPLFDSGQDDGLLWYAMPYIEGESLRERLDREKQLPVGEAVAITAKVASALQAAHDRGIVHRDIKPANILLMNGEPLVADFGIALAVQEAGGGRLTETGLSVGTPFYMSPEQATADRAPDARADIYSLGCLLYEMLAGEPPFTGSSAQAILGRILTQPPRLVTEERSSVPGHVAAAVDRALQKLPADRFPSAAEFSRALRDPAATAAWQTSRGSDGEGAPARDGGVIRRLAWPAAAAVFALVAVMGWMRQTGGETGMDVTRLILPMPDETGLSTGIPLTLNVSPDGRGVVYLRESGSGALGVFLRDLGSVDARLVFDAQATDAAFSPDGERIVVQDGANLQLVGREGGGATLLASGVMSLSTVRWAADDWIYYTSLDDDLIRIRPDGNGSETVAVPDSVGTIFMVHPLPDAGAGIVWSLSDQSVGYLRLDSGDYTRLHSGGRAWVVDDRYLVWFDDGSLRGQRFDPASGAVEGPVVDLLDGEPVTLAIGSPLVSVSESGTLVYVPGEREIEDNLVSISREGARASLGITVESDLGLTLSPGGDRVVFEERPTTRGDIYVADLSTGLRTRLTFDAEAVYPTWTPDGERVAYYRYVDDDYGLYWRPADGSGVEEVLLDGPGREIEVRFFPDGERILVRQGDRSTVDGTDIYLYRVGDPDSGLPIADGPGNEVSPQISPDGRYVAYATDELGGVQHVFVRSIEDPRERWQITDARGGNQPLWSPDGTELFYRRASALMAVPVQIRPSFRRLGEASELFETIGLVSNTNHTAYDVFPDGRRFLFIEAPQGTEARIVMGWLGELEQRLGR